MVYVHIAGLYKRGMGGQYYVCARRLVLRIAKAYVYAVLAGERKLRIDVLARAGVLGLLNDYALILVHLLSYAERCRKRRIAGRSALKAFKRCEHLCHIEHLALGNGNVAVHVPQRPCGAPRHVAPVRPGGEGHAEAGVACGKGLPVELGIACHMESTQVNACGYYLCAAAGLPKPPCGTGKVAAACVGANHRVRILAKPVAELLNYLVAERLDAYYAIRRIERRVEVACLLK